MKIQSMLSLVVAGALSLVGVAHAISITPTLAAQYFKVADFSDPDFNVYNTPNVAPGSHLGANGLPVVSAPFGINDVNPGTNEITWWSPTLNSNVVATGTGTIALPYASNMYAPNSTGSNDSSNFETAIFSGQFDLASSGTVQFKLGSDDDSFIFVDGILFGQNPGVHAVTSVTFTSPTLAAGTHNIQVFYADRQQTGAYLSLQLLTSGVVITPPSSNPVPEPPTLALLGLGLVGLGVSRRKSRNRNC